jgi:hypothetical protein
MRQNRRRRSMSLAFKMKYGKINFSKITQQHLVPGATIPEPKGSGRPMPCETLVGGKPCGHLKSTHRNTEFACMAEGCGCRRYHFTGHETN